MTANQNTEAEPGASLRARGGCLCGAVRYEVHGPLREAIACHCRQCLTWSGNYVVATQARTADLRFTADNGLAWYASSEEASRGFCRRCGSNLFWRPHGRDVTSIMAGTVVNPTGFRISHHIYADDKPDFYDITDGLPRL